MQFNIAAAHRRLDENERALAELEKAIEIGKTYGLRSDVEENYAYLQEWRGEEKDPAAIAKVMAAVPARKATFKFGWQPFTLNQQVEMDSTQIVAGKVVRSRASAAGKTRAARKGKDWIVAGEYSLLGLEAPSGEGSPDANRKMSEFLTRLFTNLPAMHVTHEGEFKDIPGVEAFATRADAEARALGKSLFPQDDPRLKQFEEAYQANIAPSLEVDVLKARTGEAHNLSVAIWVGATLEHGTAYEMPSTLSMPGTPQGQLEHKLEFTVARWLPCTSAETEPRCVEIVLHGIPNEEAVAGVVDRLARSNTVQAPWQYWARTVVRVVTDPATLVPYGADVRRYSYIGYRGPGGRVQEIRSERQLTTTVGK
jgi:hypothetical protein